MDECVRKGFAKTNMSIKKHEICIQDHIAVALAECQWKLHFCWAKTKEEERGKACGRDMELEGRRETTEEVYEYNKGELVYQKRMQG